MYVEFEEARNWYIVALDGLRHLESALHTQKRTQISPFTLELIHGMSLPEWKEFLEERESEHELFASLAVLASFEGTIRRDAAWRGRMDGGQAMYQHFEPLSREAYVSISRIFDAWESAYSRGHPLRQQFAALRRLYGDRNVIAHGRAQRGQYVFELIFSRLEEAMRKWKEFVPDFGRYA
jgi:hypothetical protein